MLTWEADAILTDISPQIKPGPLTLGSGWGSHRNLADFEESPRKLSRLRARLLLWLQEVGVRAQSPAQLELGSGSCLAAVTAPRQGWPGEGQPSPGRGLRNCSPSHSGQTFERRHPTIPPLSTSWHVKWLKRPSDSLSRVPGGRRCDGDAPAVDGRHSGSATPVLRGALNGQGWKRGEPKAHL